MLSSCRRLVFNAVLYIRNLAWHEQPKPLCVANLKPFPVAHSCIAFTACCKCLSSWCSWSGHENRSPCHQRKILWRYHESVYMVMLRWLCHPVTMYIAIPLMSVCNIMRNASRPWCRIWSWSPMPCEKHGPRDPGDKNRGRRPRFLS